MKTMKMNNLRSLKNATFVFLSFFAFCFTSCYSVFEGGTSGLIVDSESTSTPKAGIGNVDVYAYTSEGDRNSDYSSWVEGQDFFPNASYYGHTSTNNDGSFSISKLVWKSENPAFGKDADIRNIYFLFYHENYGLTKGQSLIVSDSISNTVYQELTAVRKTSVLNLSLVDVATNQNTGNSVLVNISVPQATQNNAEIKPRVYQNTITGAGVVQISYPRYKSEEDKNNGIENSPTITIKYYQNSNNETWKACFNQDNEAKDYAFRDDAKSGINVEIGSGDYDLTLYGKSTRLSMPVISGQLSATGSAEGTVEDDGVLLSMKSCGSGTEFTIDCGQVSTAAQTLGSSQNQKHGMFSGLGQGITWTDETYTDKFATTQIKLFAGETEKLTMEVRSNQNSYNVQLK